MESIGEPLRRVVRLEGSAERTTDDAMTDETEVPEAAEWHQTACILCECNCGVEVRLGGDGRTFERIRGDKAHPASKGYTCEKALRLDYYQNGRGERLLSPLAPTTGRNVRGDRLGHRHSRGRRAVGGGSRHLWR